MAREYDLVLYGATGFVGKLTAKYIAQSAPPDARIALAGRSRDKLSFVRAEIGGAAAKWGIVVANSTKQADLDALAASTKVVVTTVGPYMRYGVPLVAACAAAGTHYADLTGEPMFIRECIDRYHDAAVESGAKIVNSAGFDSVPSDLNAYLIYKQALADDTGELEDTTLVATMRGGMSGGTIDSGRAMMEAIAADPSRRRVVTDPYSLSPDRALEPDLGRESDLATKRANTIDPSLDGWVSTFIMAMHNGKVVRRSNALLGWAYGKHFRYSEVMSVGNSVLAPAMAAGVTGGIVASSVVGVALSRGVGKKVLDLILPKPGTGPSEKTRDSGFFTMKTFSRTSSGAKYRATFSAQGDPGYKATAVLLGECGMSLAFDDGVSDLAGVLTPVTAMGDTLADRYRAAGMTLTVDRVD